MNEKNYLVYLHSIWITHKKLFNIFSENQNYKDYFNILSDSALKNAWIEAKVRERILKNYEKIDTNKIDETLEKSKVQVITSFDIEYPEGLKEIANNPFMLYIQGKLNTNNSLAVIGSRKISEYGKHVIQKIIPDLTPFFTIVSGGAYGCDTWAHIETVKNNGVTYVVVWTGIDVTYPATNAKLFADVVNKWGAIISIFPLGEEWNPYNFPVRNEIISWLSKWIVVIEAWEKSGTLITANLWLEQGKDIFAVPWDITNWNSIGCNMLISSGQAKCIVNSESILEEYNIKPKETLEAPKLLNQNEKDIYNLLMIESKTLDEISKKLMINVSTLSGVLSLMEINEIIYKIDGWKYKLR